MGQAPVPEEARDAVEGQALIPRSPNPVVRVIDRTAEALGALTLGSLTLVLFANALGRYVLGNPLGWTAEVVTGLLLWVAMIGMFIAARRRDLINVRAVVQYLPQSWQLGLKVMADLVTAFVLLHLSWLGLEYLLAFGADTSAYLGLPQGFFTVSIPIGALAVALAVLFQLRTARQDQEAIDAQEAVPDEGGENRT